MSIEKYKPSFTQSALVSPEIANDFQTSLDRLFGLDKAVSKETVDARLHIGSIAVEDLTRTQSGDPETIKRINVDEHWELDEDGELTQTGLLKLAIQDYITLQKVPSTGLTEIKTPNSGEGLWVTRKASLHFDENSIFGTLSREFSRTGIQGGKTADAVDSASASYLYADFLGFYEPEILQAPCTDYDVHSLAKEINTYVSLNLLLSSVPSDIHK